MFHDKQKIISGFNEVINRRWNPDVDKILLSSLIALIVGLLLWLSSLPYDKILVKYSIILSITSATLSILLLLWHLLNYKKRTQKYLNSFELEFDKISSKTESKLNDIWKNLLEPLYHVFKKEIESSSIETFDLEMKKKMMKVLIDSQIFSSLQSLESNEIREAIHSTSFYDNQKHKKMLEFGDDLAVKYRYPFFVTSLFFLLVSIITYII